MGTNYYLHLGKRSAGPAGRPHTFTWAADRNRLVREQPGPVICDEYGRVLTWAEFYELVGADISDEASTGREFC